MYPREHMSIMLQVQNGTTVIAAAHFALSGIKRIQQQQQQQQVHDVAVMFDNTTTTQPTTK